MNFYQYFWLILFWLMQIVAHGLFKFGSSVPKHYYWGFICGNVVGVLSIIPLMKLYSLMQINIAIALCLAGGFMMTQIALAIIFSQHLSLLQWCGLLLIVVGMIIVVSFPPITNFAKHVS